jgi:predicted  nucleic acid-binding Zn-ribbon protein
MEDPIVRKIKSQFDKKGNPVKIPLMSGKQFFEARQEKDGIYVDSLKDQPFLPWEVFSEAINCLKENGGKAKKGNATNAKLGNPNLDMNTVEGCIASKVYGCKTGDVVFKRIEPVASILAWAELCENKRGQIYLIPENKEKPVINNEDVSRLKTELKARNENIGELEKTLSDSEKTIKTLEKKLADYKNELEKREKFYSQKEEKFRELEKRIWEKDFSTWVFEENLAKNVAEIGKSKYELIEKEGNISIKDRDLKILAGEVIRIKEELAGKEKKLSNMETMLVKNEEKIKKLEKQLSDYKGEEKLVAQLREKEEFIKQLKGTLASKEEAYSRLTEENKKYKMQQKYASDGLRQIEEQKTSKKWWKRL